MKVVYWSQSYFTSRHLKKPSKYHAHIVGKKYRIYINCCKLSQSRWSHENLLAIEASVHIWPEKLEICSYYSSWFYTALFGNENMCKMLKKKKKKFTVEIKWCDTKLNSHNKAFPHPLLNSKASPIPADAAWEPSRVTSMSPVWAAPTMVTLHCNPST